MKALDNIISIYFYLSPVIDVAILTFLLYQIYTLIVKTNSIQLVKAFVIVGVFYALAFLLP